MLEAAEGGTCQDTERNRPNERHSPTGDSIGRDLSGHGKKPTERGTLTLWGRQREGLLRTRKETNRAMRTHVLETAEGGICQDTDRNRQSGAHSHPGDSRGRDLSGHIKETNRARHTHKLETAEGETCQDTERNQRSEAHSLPGYGTVGDLSGHGKKPTEQGALTSWRWQREGLVRTRQETNRAGHTHQLETAEEEICQDTERNRPSKAHSLSGDGKGKDSSGRRKKRADQGTLTSWRRQRERLVRTRKEPTEQGTLTS